MQRKNFGFIFQNEILLGFLLIIIITSFYHNKIELCYYILWYNFLFEMYTHLVLSLLSNMLFENINQEIRV